PHPARSFEHQKTDDAIYFRVEFAAPPHVADEPAPRLVPQDSATRTVVRVFPGGLAFAGKWSPSAESAKFQLIYTAREPGRMPVAVESSVALDLSNSVTFNGDLKRQWALGQMAEFARLRKQAPDFNFYSLAQLLLARKYELPVP